jgi:hypothetical protein
MSISLGQLFRLTGWSLLTAAWIVLLARDLVFRGYSLLFDLGCIATMVLLGRCLISAGRILSSGDGWYEIRPGNPFVLYLRSFEDDGVAHFDIMRGLLKVFVPRTSIEEELVRAIRVLGPVIALADPNKVIRAPGASRISVRGEEWEALVVELMRDARFVVMLPGAGDAFRRELSWARQTISPERLVIYFPEDLRATPIIYREDGQRREYSEFLKGLLVYQLGSRIPERTRTFSFLWFRPGWCAKPLWPADECNLFPRNTTSELQAELRPVFDHFGARRQQNPELRQVASLLAKLATFRRKNEGSSSLA